MARSWLRTRQVFHLLSQHHPASAWKSFCSMLVYAPRGGGGIQPWYVHTDKYLQTVHTCANGGEKVSRQRRFPIFRPIIARLCRDTNIEVSSDNSITRMVSCLWTVKIKRHRTGSSERLLLIEKEKVTQTAARQCCGSFTSNHFSSIRLQNGG